MTLTKLAGESRLYVFDFSNRKELIAGETLEGTPTVEGSPTGLSISAAEVTDAVYMGVPAGEGVIAQIASGTEGTSYTVTATVTTSGGSILAVRGVLSVS